MSLRNVAKITDTKQEDPAVLHENRGVFAYLRVVFAENMRKIFKYT